jgi:hypothetical protein
MARKREPETLPSTIPEIQGEVITGEFIDPETGEMVRRVMREALVEKAIWSEPADVEANRPFPRQIKAYRRVNVLHNLCNRTKLITMAHVRAGDRFRADFEISQMGYNFDYGKIRVDGGAVDSDLPRQAYGEMWAAAVRAVGPAMAEILTAVVLFDMPLREWGRLRGIRDEGVVKGYLLAALAALMDHYRVIARRRD